MTRERESERQDVIKKKKEDDEREEGEREKEGEVWKCRESSNEKD